MGPFATGLCLVAAGLACWGARPRGRSRAHDIAAVYAALRALRKWERVRIRVGQLGSASRRRAPAASADFEAAATRPLREFTLALGEHGCEKALHCFSQIGFDRRRGEAVVQTSWQRGPTCGSEVTLLLRKSPSGEWAVAETLQSLIS